MKGKVKGKTLGPCFTCGQPRHSYLQCPDRFSKGGGRGKFFIAYIVYWLPILQRKGQATFQGQDLLCGVWVRPWECPGHQHALPPGEWGHGHCGSFMGGVGHRRNWVCGRNCSHDEAADPRPHGWSTTSLFMTDRPFGLAMGWHRGQFNFSSPLDLQSFGWRGALSLEWHGGEHTSIAWLQSESAEGSHHPHPQSCERCGLPLKYVSKGKATGEARAIGPPPDQVEASVLRCRPDERRDLQRQVDGISWKRWWHRRATRAIHQGDGARPCWKRQCHQQGHHHRPRAQQPGQGHCWWRRRRFSRSWASRGSPGISGQSDLCGLRGGGVRSGDIPRSSKMRSLWEALDSFKTRMRGGKGYEWW